MRVVEVLLFPLRMLCVDFLSSVSTMPRTMRMWSKNSATYSHLMAVVVVVVVVVVVEQKLNSDGIENE